jgi:hypothetical protein
MTMVNDRRFPVRWRADKMPALSCHTPRVRIEADLGGKTRHLRVQSAASDEQQREAGTGLLIGDANGASFVELGVA